MQLVQGRNDSTRSHSDFRERSYRRALLHATRSSDHATPMWRSSYRLVCPVLEDGRDDEASKAGNLVETLKNKTFGQATGQRLDVVFGPAKVGLGPLFF